MRKYLHSAVLGSMLASLALVLTHPDSAAAQQLSSSTFASSESPRPADPVETVSIENLPSAPVASLRPHTFRTTAAAMPAAVAPVMAVQPYEAGPHRFWDRENSLLFASAGAAAAADFCVTRANLASGGKELNPLTRVFAGSTPALATNFALETAGVVGVSYIFHKTGHHQLERLTSFVNIGASATAVGYSLAHR